MDSENFVVGDTREFSVQITDDIVRKFADLSGDHNPIHLDDAYAATTRFKKRIAHGMICGALISRCLAQQLGQGGIYLAQEMKFMNPVFINDTVTVLLKVLSIRQGNGICKIETLCKNQHGELCVKGEATIMKPTALKLGT